MTNRRKIELAAKEFGYKIKNLEFIRERDHLYGDSWDCSYWTLETECGESFFSDMGDTLKDSIDIMIEEMKKYSKLNKKSN